MPAPASTSTLVLDVAYKPTKAATVLPDFLLEEYEEAICAGTKARLQVMPKKGWSDTQQAAINASMFNDAIVNARFRQSKGFGRSRLRTQARFL